MTSLVDPEEVEVSNRLELSVRRAINSVLGKRRGLELSAVGIVEVVHYKLATVPVADPVKVARYIFVSR